MLRRLLLALPLAVLLCSGALAHKLQVEPIVAVLRPQERFLSVEFTGNVQDITQSVDATDADKRGDGFSDAVNQRVLAYFNERFQIRQGDTPIPAELVALSHQSGLDPTRSKFRLALRYPRPTDAPSDEPVTVTNQLLDYLPNARVIVSTGGLSKSLAHGDTAAFDPSAFAVNLWRNLKDFAVLGVEHIFTGPDHMLFIVALLLVSTSFPQLIKTLTGFTIAHSVTLVLSALSLVVLGERLTDILVALSIVYVGVENIVLARRAAAAGTPRPSAHRFWVASAFGLVHGFGFSGVLREIGLPEGAARFWSLLSFNVGVEIAQVALCALAFPLLTAWRRGIERRGPIGQKQWLQNLQVASLLVSLAGGKWLFERAFLS